MKKISKAKILSSVKSDEYLVVDPKGDLIVVFDGDKAEEHGMHVIKRLYRAIPGSDMMEIVCVEEVVDQLAEALIHAVDVKELLVRTLREMPPPALLKVKEVADKYPEALKNAKTQEGCFYIDLEVPQVGEPNVPIYIRS